MIKYLGPKLKKLKRLNLSILPGFSTKFNLKYYSFKNIISSSYSTYLLEKQKLKFLLNLKETQIKKYLYYLKRYKKLNLISIINLRLDVFLFNIGFCKTILESRQWISHGHILINYKIIKKPSEIVKKNNIISINLIKKSILKLCKQNIYNKYYNNKNINDNNIICEICLDTYKSRIYKYNIYFYNWINFNNNYIYNYYY